jgi:transglutaminase-like putative cysteine protease
MLRPWLFLTAAATIGCVTRTVKPPQAVAVHSPSGKPGGAEEVARLALMLDASGDAKADTLYAPDALVVENARVRLSTPRFAAIANQSGRVTITAATESEEGRFAWVLLDYNWVNPAERRVDPGRATVICERRGESWKIVHVHSSQPLPWEP